MQPRDIAARLAESIAQSLAERASAALGRVSKGRGRRTPPSEGNGQRTAILGARSA